MTEFTCNSRELSAFLRSRGFRQLRTENGKYVFEYGDGIDKAVDEYESIRKRCMF